jgi:pilus assembly protein CpaB
VALVTAAVAALIIVVAINRYRHNVNTSNSQTSVLVANGLIQKGSSFASIASAGLYAPSKVIEKRITPGAITDASALAGKVAVTNILPGQQLTAADFAVSSGVATELAANQRAIAIALDSSHGLSGIVQAGDHVDVYAGFTTGAGSQVRLLVPDVLVLSSSTSGGGIGSSSSGNIVLAVDDNQAAQVAYASDNGKIWLTLRPGNAKNPAQTVASLASILASSPSAIKPGKP